MTREKYETFGSKRNPVNKQSKLWRYLNFEKFAWLIEKECLYHARLDLLGDQFEGSVTKQYANLRNSGKIHGYMSDPSMEEINNRRRLYINFVSCWHKSETESPAMWKLYSNEHEGIAIVTSFEKLKMATDTSSSDYALLGPVEYFDFENDDMSLEFGRMGRIGYSKRKEFLHEQEIRAMVTKDVYPKNMKDINSENHISHLKETQPNGVQIPVNLKELISEIIVSPKCEESFFDLIKTYLYKNELSDLVKKSNLSGLLHILTVPELLCRK